MQVRDWEDVVVVAGAEDVVGAEEEDVVVAGEERVVVPFVVVVASGSRGRNILPIPCVVMHNLVPASSVRMRLM